MDLELITLLSYRLRPCLITELWFRVGGGVQRSSDDIGGHASRWEQNCPNRCSSRAAHKWNACMQHYSRSASWGRASRAVSLATFPPLALPWESWVSWWWPLKGKRQTGSDHTLRAYYIFVFVCLWERHFLFSCLEITVKSVGRLFSREVRGAGLSVQSNASEPTELPLSAPPLPAPKLPLDFSFSDFNLSLKCFQS